ncbi:uncharacterized protein HD556DRAFT_1455509 [Suillus plorans]|uniref:Hydrophobin n=1 Tax=Suillus plorans TaxID=116603 RepID=A0A9P7DPL4_9AGAM|nr:uncharacterized protein HD556DRAFT_1455509 [Suillus plorans]KAG1799874.1 hypothetical protein HD556DRAFT_1455509 [Suillus plorans]
MFARFFAVAFLVVLAVATPLTSHYPWCRPCCESSASTSEYNKVARSLGLEEIPASVAGHVACSCNPISAVGIGSGATCNRQPMCCSNNQMWDLTATINTSTLVDGTAVSRRPRRVGAGPMGLVVALTLLQKICKWMVGFDGAKDIVLGLMFSVIFVQKALVFTEWANICMVNKLSQGPVSVVGGLQDARLPVISEILEIAISILNQTITTGDIPIQQNSILSMSGVRCRFNNIVLDKFAIPGKPVMHMGVLGEGHLEAGDKEPHAPNMLQVEDGKSDVKTPL